MKNVIEWLKKVSKKPLFLPLVSVFLVLIINVVYDAIQGNYIFEFLKFELKEGALYVISSMLLGVAFLALAYQNLINFRIFNKKLFDRFRYSFEGIVTLLLGSYILVVPDIENSWYMLSCGSLLLIDAIFETLKMLRDRKKK